LHKIEGVYAANVTPFKDDNPLVVDIDAYLAHASWLAEMGVRGIVPFGTNGEGPSVALGEKLQVLEALFEEELPLQILPVVMQGNLPDTLQMLQALEEYPATAVLVLPPYYFKPATAEGLKRFFEPVLEESRHPVIIYHIPKYAVLVLPPYYFKPASAEGLERFYEPVLASSRHPVIVYHIPKYAVPVPEKVVTGLPAWGVKDSAGEPGYAEAVLKAGKGVLIGTEDDLWQKLNLGAQGVISALANFIPEKILEMHEKAKTGDEAAGKALSEKLQEVRAMTKEYASPAVLKQLAEARHGAPMGTVRPPYVPVPADYDPGPTLEASFSAVGS
jgi:4-hydroxy-tetrahydrodipicolinate synthase